MEVASWAAAGRELTMLWMLWAAKEASYKALAKSDVTRPFRPADLQVTVSDNAGRPGSCRRYGKVRTGRALVHVDWEINARFIHCVGVIRCRSSTSEALRYVRPISDLMSSRALETRTAIESVAVRRLACLELAAEFGEEDVDVVREIDGDRLKPPQFVRGGVRLDNYDLSLSHDGDYVAVALLSLGSGCNGPFAPSP